MVAVKYLAPRFTTHTAAQIAAEVYGLTATADALPGEHDQNFRLTTPEGAAFVLKISHADEQPDILDLQNRALDHLANRAPQLLLPRVCRTTGGAAIATITDDNGVNHLIRLLTYIPGKLFIHTRPHTPELLYSLGHLLGQIDRALLDFEHPAAQRSLKWDLPRAGWIRAYLGHIADPQRRALVERFLNDFERETLPALPKLRASVIYNDANDYNILVDRLNGEQCVVSVIDFGDLLHTTTIGELAIAIAYASLDKPDPLAAAAQIVAGYHAALPLSEAELAVLYPLICARLCVSVTNSAYQQVIDPDNTYLQVSDRPAWTLLEYLADVPPPLAHYTFRHACGLPPCPTAPAVVQWLQDHPDQLGRVVEPDLRVEPCLVFDLSVGSRELGNVPDFTDTATLTRNLFGQMQAAGVRVGLGRYDEARPFYTGPQFQGVSNDGLEWRTVHLGLDLFVEPGAPVFAPLAGVVHSLDHNAAPLDYGPTVILRHTVAGGQLTFYTLYGHLSAESLAGLSPGQVVTRGQQIATIGDVSVNGGWPPHLHFQIICDLLGREGEFPGVARPSQREIWLSLSPDPNLMVGVPAERFPAPELDIPQILAVRRERLGRNLSISYRKPLTIVRGFRQYLYAADGRMYLDAVNNVPHVGHNHPWVVRAGQRQMAVLNTNTRYLHEGLIAYAERLVATLPEPLRVCYFVCSGSEATELALRLARAHTRQRDLIVSEGAYHGNTSTLIDISPYKAEGPGGQGLAPWVHKAPMPDPYRGAFKRDDPLAGPKYARALAKLIADIQAEGRGLSAFIIESLLSCGGQIVLPDGYLREAYRLVRQAGGVCIADEVQVGFGRVGTHFWGFETQGVIPDIVAMGKPMGNGHPLGAVVTTPEIAASFNNGMEYFNTFGGNPVSCAIGQAVLDVLAEEELQAQALRVGARLLAGLAGLRDRHELVGDVRGLGLMVGVELVRNRETLAPAEAQASYIANRMREHGILLSTDGPFHNVLKIKPPLVFDEANADRLVATLDQILGEDLAQAG